ncbi:DUF1176 domain-containing protein [hydrothermal vent metagenome]|uniref:DUF1176 domain-containing protein n=1 Tax=hydrothermal vent metagenome TaxID=652676 RepID=A0A1W1C0C5_9ZZZZ
MEKMDDYQKRVGTIGALYKKGDLNESEVLKAQKIPIIYSPSVDNNHGELNVVSLSPDEKKLLQAKLDTFYGDKKDCWEDTNEARKTLKAYSISKKSLMVEQICWSAAYNNSNAFWLVSKKPPYTPKFLGDARYLMIAEDGSLRMGRTIKSRGIGDCFYIQRSVWDGQSFRLLLDATTGLCKGFTGGAWTLPSFQSKVEVTTSEFRASQPSAKAKEILHKENDKLADAKDYESILKLYRENARIYRNKIYENLKQHIIELKLDDEKTNELLMIELSLLKSQVNYYYINKILWHSQFDLFNGWLSNGLSITNNELETYFNVIVKNKYDYSFDTDSQWDYITYIAYPLSAGIIEYTGESYKLTDLGNSYIRFMRKNMYLVAELAKL